MAVNSTHPAYDHMLDIWRLCRVSYAGEEAVKNAGEKYLPPTPSMVLDGYSASASIKNPNKGTAAYLAYKKRAVFHDFFTDAVKYFVGMLNQKPAQIEVPDAMQPLVDKTSNMGESALALLRRIHAEQLTTGRLGLMVDIPTNPDPTNPMPYVAFYSAECVINWDDSNDGIGVNSINLVVLDESGPRRKEDYTWVDEYQYRVLEMRNLEEKNETGIPVDRTVVTVKPNGQDVYKQAVINTTQGGSVTPSPEQFTIPVFRGKPMEEIPFVFVNASDITTVPDAPPLVGLARLCMAIYRLEADYRQALYMQGQDTLVTIGGVMDATPDAENSTATTSDGVRVGAGARIDLNMGGDAKYIGVSGEGLSEMREALNGDKKAAETKSGQLISPAAGKQESGDALSTRLSAQTASLHQIAKTSALALQNALRKAAVWMGADPEKVIVTPNLEFIDKQLVAKELVDLLTARTLGAPLSLESIHKLITDRGLSEMSFEEEMALIEEEDMAAVRRTAKEFQNTPPGAPGGPPVQPEPGPGNQPPPKK